MLRSCCWQTAAPVRASSEVLSARQSLGVQAVVQKAESLPSPKDKRSTDVEATGCNRGDSCPGRPDELGIQVLHPASDHCQSSELVSNGSINMCRKSRILTAASNCIILKETSQKVQGKQIAKRACEPSRHWSNLFAATTRGPGPVRLWKSLEA